MPVLALNKNPKIYTCMSYYIYSGTKYGKKSAIIDPGTDAYTIDEVSQYQSFSSIPPVSHIILTHCHFDHAGGCSEYIKRWNPEVIAYSMLDYVTQKAENKMKIDLGFDIATIYHTPGHTVDSISIYLEREKALFTGDTLINVRTNLGTYHSSFIDVLKLYLSLDIKTLYAGHDAPYTENIKPMLENSLKNVLNSKIFN